MHENNTLNLKYMSVIHKLIRNNSCLIRHSERSGKSFWYVSASNGKTQGKADRKIKCSDAMISELRHRNMLLPRPDGSLILSAAACALVTKPKQGFTDNDRFQLQHQTRRQAAVDKPGPSPQINLSESPLGWLRSRKDSAGKPFLTQAQFDAGEKLRRDYEFASMEPQITQSWGMKIDGGRRGQGAQRHDVLNASEHSLAARQRVDQALNAVGPELSSVLVQICCLASGLEAAERTLGWPKRSARLVLQIALSQLATHYGYTQSSTAPTRSPSIRHSGGEGYRPNSKVRTH